MRKLVLLLMIPGAQAATLAPDSLVCESDSDLSFIASEKLPGPGGAKLMTQINASAQGYRLAMQSAGVMRDLAVREESIRAGKLRGSNTAQATTADSDVKSNAEKAAMFEKAGKSCAAMGPATVDVVERKPISGLAKVRADFNGTKADVWTHAASVKD